MKFQTKNGKKYFTITRKGVNGEPVHTQFGPYPDEIIGKEAHDRIVSQLPTARNVAASEEDKLKKMLERIGVDPKRLEE